MNFSPSGSETASVYLLAPAAFQTEMIVGQVFRQDVLGDIR